MIIHWATALLQIHKWWVQSGPAHNFLGPSAQKSFGVLWREEAGGGSGEGVASSQKSRRASPEFI